MTGQQAVAEIRALPRPVSQMPTIDLATEQQATEYNDRVTEAIHDEVARPKASSASDGWEALAYSERPRVPWRAAHLTDPTHNYEVRSAQWPPNSASPLWTWVSLRRTPTRCSPSTATS
ncbi:hypothetical protein MMAN_21350 [Mycobacterium mantenii]|uniref:Uncharacterized protein n=1 Tax=Mycobacterium mantenii TaxID=560555 RepID=A0ABN6A949_MYCNT|nr:hypothetical protein MMAN_21350 [Mycobacterium mantenii]